MSYHLVIDRAACSGFGSCVDSAPDIFEMGGDGIATAASTTDHLEAALSAARECPMGAITVLDDEGNEVR
jgi:ferredoxin